MTHPNKNFPISFPSNQVGASDIGNQPHEIDLFVGWFAGQLDNLGNSSQPVAAVNLPSKFEVPKEMFEVRKDPRVHLMQYNDYMNILGAYNVEKWKAFLTTLRGSAND
ncbi:hypothetical protein PVK06_048222 [Gossypium arboreum]|uniref:Uncharacterized protein n=1 Tax=Gossypium arboreum TaxID=29729 RepID=A0ABR0MFD3_GOSAR|nr:hypothetical protein PVK06_048222 [Gossypium arboreum]